VSRPSRDNRRYFARPAAAGSALDATVSRRIREGVRELGLPTLVLAVLDEPLERELPSGRERTLRRHLHVGLDARPFPVRLRHRVDRAAGRDEHRETPGERNDPARVGAAAACLADDRRALLRLQVVRALLGARERGRARQDVDVLVEEAPAGTHGSVQYCFGLVRR
jgi:hypothetical protein